MLGVSGWASFTLYERTTQAAVGDPAPVNPRVEQLVAEGFKHLAADELEIAAEKLNQAVGAVAGDPRANEGLVLVFVRRAERVYWELALTREPNPQLIEKLDDAVHKARETIANVRRSVTDQPTLDRIGMQERHLNTLLVVAFVRAGANERARGALAARLATHPQHKLLESFVGASPLPAASGSASAAPSAAASAPTATPPGMQPPVVRPPGVPPSYPGSSYEPHYEFDNEPAMKDKPKTEGELLLPPPSPPSD